VNNKSAENADVLNNLPNPFYFAAGFFFVFALGFVQFWDGRFKMKGDGISYLDLADSYLRIDLQAIANSSWSPLYPFVIAACKKIANPSPEFEFPFVHAVNFLIFAAALIAFHWTFFQIVKDFAASVKIYVAYLASLSLLTYCAVGLISVSSVTPDMLLLGALILLTGIYAKWKQTKNWNLLFVLGAICGIAYLCKAAFFPVSLVALAVLFVEIFRKHDLNKALLPIAGFALIAAPWIIFLSFEKGRLTFSDIGWINYCIDVKSCENFNSTYRERLENSSDILIFNTIYKDATFPPWFDLSESRMETVVRFSAAEQFDTTAKSVKHAAEIVFNIFTIPFFIFCLSIAFFRRRKFVESFKIYWFPALLSLAAICAYLTTHIEERYLAPLLFPLLLPFIVCYLKSNEEEGELNNSGNVNFLFSALLIFAALALLCTSIYPTFKNFGKTSDAFSADFAAAQKAEALGINPGDKVIVFGDGVRLYWARLARIKIVGESVDPNFFWNATGDQKQAILCELQGKGINAIVTNLVVPKNDSENWKEVDWRKSYVFIISCPAK
jgi:4-amino-4-deoxy-L-arabinose transferase-like glycosyltransferase